MLESQDYEIISVKNSKIIKKAFSFFLNKEN